MAGLVGNVLEWYDFSIYGYFAPMVGHHFFPAKNSSTSLIAAFAVFSAGFFTRPLGALVFGYIGDRYSRERALTISILAMALPTCTTGFMPTYQSIGVTASIILVVLRLIQGLSAGGEYTTSIVFLVEHSTHGRRGLMGSFGLFGSIAGGMLGSATGAALTYLMPREVIMAWGWRIPFILGIAPAFFGIMIRRALRNAPIHPSQSEISLGNLLIQQWRSVARVFGFELLEAVGFYMTFIYLSTYLTRVVNVPEHLALIVNTLCMAFVLMVIPLSGSLSDRLGRKPLLLTAAIAAACFAWPLFRILQHPGFGSILAGELGLATIIGLYEGAAPAAAAEVFPMSVRATGVALAFNLCMTLFGGTTPMVATSLIALTQSNMAPPIYLATAALISGLVVLTLRETAKTPLTS
ncbi:MAG TPA: MFS transporter [Candidatus Binataceae bacterium]|nr:MFS transporter [Candidatus Binataceae bacterium]